MSKHALVLTGTLLPGHEADHVWPALAAYFRMDERKVADQLVPRAPVTLKESDDLAKLEGLRDGLRDLGADSEIHAIDGPNLFVVIAGKPRGPVPHAFVDARVASGEWSAASDVAEVGSERWQPFSRLNVQAAAPPPPPPRADTAETAYMAAPRDLPQSAEPLGGFAPRPSAERDATTGAGLEYGEMLPPGEAIHAGFWRRGAAMFVDGVIVNIPLALVGSASPFGGLVVGIVVIWLYFALMESSTAQATLGKQALGIKVVDDYGRRIDFARATGRHFGKILSALIVMIGYIMAGLTVRKQGLHDSLASCCVVFRDVDPEQPLPTVREPMPWYGWAINIFFLTVPPLLFVFALYALFFGIWRW